MPKLFYAQRLAADDIQRIKRLARKMNLSEALVISHAVAAFESPDPSVKRPKADDRGISQSGVLERPLLLKPSAKSL